MYENRQIHAKMFTLFQQFADLCLWVGGGCDEVMAAWDVINDSLLSETTLSVLLQKKRIKKNEEKINK